MGWTPGATGRVEECPRPLTLLSCWWMSCFSSEAFSGGSDMLGPALRSLFSPLQEPQPRGRPAQER